MKKPLLLLLLFLFIGLLIFGYHMRRANPNMLMGQTFMAQIGVTYEETPDDNPCAGLVTYLKLEFSEDYVSVIDKEISSCEDVSVTSNLSYKWDLMKSGVIKIHSEPEEIANSFLNEITLKIENGDLIGYKKEPDNQRHKFVFMKNMESYKP